MRFSKILLKEPNYSVRHISAGRRLPTSLPLCCVVVFCFSPIVAYWLTLFLLLALSDSISAIDRRLFTLVVVLSGSAIWASRAFGAVAWDDFIHYYQTYAELYQGNWSYLFRYGSGIEVGLPAVFLIFSWILPKLTPNGLMFFQSVLCGLLFIWMSEKYLLKEFDQKRRGAVMVLCFLYYSFFLSTQFSRQFFASLIIIPILFDKRIKIILLIAGISFFVHMSSLAIIFLYFALLSMNLWAVIITITIIYSLISYNQDTLSAYISYISLSADLTGRFNTFSQIGDIYGQNMSAIKTQIYPLLAILTTLLWLLISKNKMILSNEKKMYEKKMMIFYISVFLLYLSTIHFYSFPHRFFLMVHGIMIGWFMALFLRRLPYTIFLIVLYTLFGWNLLIELKQDWNSWPPGSIYSLIYIYPGYFFLHYFV